MSAAMRRLARPDAAADVVTLILEQTNGTGTSDASFYSSEGSATLAPQLVVNAVLAGVVPLAGDYNDDGVVDAADSVRIASGMHGVYAIPAQWQAGDYDGTAYPSFARTMAPGESASETITLHNPSDESVEVTLSAQALRRIGHYEDSITTDRTEESPASGAPWRDGA